MARNSDNDPNSDNDQSLAPDPMVMQHGNKDIDTWHMALRLMSVANPLGAVDPRRSTDASRKSSNSFASSLQFVWVQYNGLYSQSDRS